MADAGLQGSDDRGGERGRSRGFAILLIACASGCTIDFSGQVRPGWDLGPDSDGGSPAEDAGTADGGAPETDASPPSMDAAPPDAGPTDGGPPSCDPATCRGLRCVGTECGYYADCRELLDSGLALTSKDYWIQPAASPDPLIAYCDMGTDGGGWTLVFLAEVDNYDRTLAGYTETGAMAVLATATEALLAFRAPPLGRVISPSTLWARVEMPPEWRTTFPTGFAGEERTVMTLVQGEAAASPRELVFGFGEFRTDPSPRSGRCEMDWATWDTDYGRICIRGTEAPFYSATHSSHGDRCTTSSQSWDAYHCDAMRRFSIAVR